MADLRVGLTGGIAAGKSTVAAWLRDAGFIVIDADQIVADLYRPGGDGATAVANLFGAGLLTALGAVDHPRLAQRVFSDPLARDQLEAAIHPLVKRDFEALAEAETGIVIFEAPLLVEAGFAPDFDLIVTVEAEPETRIRRAVERGLSPPEARARFAAQTGESTRTEVAQVILRNDRSIEALRVQVENLIEELRRLARHEP